MRVLHSCLLSVSVAHREPQYRKLTPILQVLPWPGHFPPTAKCQAGKPQLGPFGCSVRPATDITTESARGWKQGEGKCTVDPQMMQG